MDEKYKKLLDAAKAAHAILNDEYLSKKNEADWYNNNMPGVGQTIDYMTIPAKSQALIILETAINP